MEALEYMTFQMAIGMRGSSAYHYTGLVQKGENTEIR